MTSKNATIPYVPRHWQAVMHQKLTRFTVMVIHRRAGKTTFAAAELVKRALQGENRPQVAYIAPTYKQAKQVSWEILKNLVADIPHVKVNESELRIDLPNKGRILVLGAENPDSLRGLYLDYAVLDEVAQMPQPLWKEVVRPALADRKGGALFIGTPKGENFFHKIYLDGCSGRKGWSSILMTPEKTNALDQEELDALKEELTEEEYEQEIMCSFSAAIRGAYYVKQIAAAEADGRVTSCHYDPDYPVITAWDIGFDGTSIWYAQMVMDKLHIIDFDHFVEEDIPHCLNVVKNKPYVYEYQILPHDAVKRQQVDHRKSVKGLITSHGLKCRVARRSDLIDGINAGRRLIQKSVFNRAKTHKGLISLRQYRSQYDESRGILLSTPVHDEHSHPADAWRTLAMGLKEGPSAQTRKRTGVVGNYDPYRPNYTTVSNWDVYNAGV